MDKEKRMWERRGYPRTDLACEVPQFRGRAKEEILRLGDGGAPVTLLRSTEEGGGRYVTMSCGRITARSEGELAELADRAPYLGPTTKNSCRHADIPWLSGEFRGSGKVALCIDYDVNENRYFVVFKDTKTHNSLGKPVLLADDKAAKALLTNLKLIVKNL